GVPPDLQVNEFVREQLYGCILGRPSPGVAEVAYWRGQIVARLITPAQVYEAFFASQEYAKKNVSDEAFAKQLYQCVLFREPESAEAVQYWASQPQRSVTLEKFLGSSEFQNGIAPALDAMVWDGMRQTVSASHVAGDYRFATGSFLLEGARYVQNMGSDSIFVYLTPRYKIDYPGDDFGSPRTLKELAMSKPYQELFKMPFRVFVITVFTFTNCDWNPQMPFSAARATAEANEVQELADYLMKTYRGTGKKFILKNWEGDWWLAGVFDPVKATEVSQAVVDSATAWWFARQTGVDRARAANPDSDVKVLHAIEFVLLPPYGSVLSRIVPYVWSDMVAYSAWRTTTWPDRPIGAPEEIRQRIMDDVWFIRSYPGVGERPLMISEYGFPEKYFSDSGKRAEVAARAFLEAGVEHAFFWEILDNECEKNMGESGAPGNCPGFGLIRKDGTRAPAWYALRHILDVRNNAEFVGELPAGAVMEAGKQYKVSLTFRNTGDIPWDAANGYRLGSWNPQDNFVWGQNRIELASGESVPPGGQKTFTFTITVPTAPGTYQFQWRMVQDGAEWFGGVSPNVAVEVK
ncbi:DUF4214 domain-containing protein, partial [Patescibacteria group bacterium]|nr:DUF4214 domain-containing protein [Patescibacteria group bacterium]